MFHFFFFEKVKLTFVAAATDKIAEIFILVEICFFFVSKLSLLSLAYSSSYTIKVRCLMLTMMARFLGFIGGG